MTGHKVLYLSHADVEAIIRSMQEIIDLLESPSGRDNDRVETPTKLNNIHRISHLK